MENKEKLANDWVNSIYGVKIKKDEANDRLISKNSFIAGWDACLNNKKPKKKNVEILDEIWVDFKKETPKEASFYSTKVSGSKEEISDYWSNNYFVYNDHLITHWKRK
jgi:hypothetical protein